MWPVGVLTAFAETADEPIAKKNGGKTLKNKLGALAKQIENGDYQKASYKLASDFLAKTDGCQSQGSLDSNDWIDVCGDVVIDFTNPDGQEEFAAIISLSIAYMQSLP